MAIIRLTHVSELPSPDELIRKLEKQNYSNAQVDDVKKKNDIKSTVTSSIVSSKSGVTIAKVEEIIEDPLQQFKTFEDVISLIRFNRDMKLLVETENYLKLVKYQPGRIEFQLTQEASTDLPSRLAKKLKSWTGKNWGITIVNEGGGPTIAEKRNANKQSLHLEVMEHPMVKSVMENFPGSNIHEVHIQKLPLENSDSDEMLVSQEEAWDPFEEDN